MTSKFNEIINDRLNDIEESVDNIDIEIQELSIDIQNQFAEHMQTVNDKLDDIYNLLLSLKNNLY